MGSLHFYTLFPPFFYSKNPAMYPVILKATDKYVRVTKTRVATSGKAEKVITSNIQISEVEKVDIHPQLEADTGIPADTIENIVRVVPAKKQKKQQKANHSVSGPIP